MKIAHVCLTGPYNDGWTYQENMLARHHRLMGHDVVVLATPYSTDVETGKFQWFEVGRSINTEDVQIVRLPPVFGRTPQRWSRLSVYRDVRRCLEAYSPDVVFVHGCQFLDAVAVAKYCRGHGATQLYVDNHADWFNSASNWVSRKVLHGIIWRTCAKALEPHACRFWGVTRGSCQFLSEVYGIPPTKVELLPLGADGDELGDADRVQIRAAVRGELGVSQGDFLVVAGGKIDRNKNIHLLMRAIQSLTMPNVRLLVFGSVLDDVRDEFLYLAESPQITYVGWTKPLQIARYLCAADLAVFPGTQSALWSQTILAGVPALFRRWDGGTPVDIGGNCILLETGDAEEISGVLQRIMTDSRLYQTMRTAAQSSARMKFAYSRIARLAIGVGP
ncbi:MAG: glycosyltransferase family 4 protein [Coriobacteriia bacterium]|nr:glycosyltransferase family 4 protein [Coriobacteriia bacterium]